MSEAKTFEWDEEEQTVEEHGMYSKQHYEDVLERIAQARNILSAPESVWNGIVEVFADRFIGDSPQFNYDRFMKRWHELKEQRPRA